MPSQAHPPVQRLFYLLQRTIHLTLNYGIQRENLKFGTGRGCRFAAVRLRFVPVLVSSEPSVWTHPIHQNIR
jgi:hypothetical protein